MKIPFDIKFRPQIESEEYKVETRDGKPVKLLSINSYNTRPIIGEVELDGKTVYISTDENGSWTEGNGENQFDLFLVTPEEEMTGFEKGYMRIVHKMKPEDFNDEGLKIAKEEAAELLELAKKELCESGEVTDWYAKGKAEALRTRATELTKNLDKSGLDKDSIPYHLIEFMCNLYTCPNWKEIEETAELYVSRIKAAAMKDLPRWKVADRDIFSNIIEFAVPYTNDGGDHDDWVEVIVTNSVHKGEQYFEIPDLEKLPGFKED